MGSIWMFLVHMLTGKNPLFRPDMLADRNFLAGLLFMFVLGLVMMSGMALMPPMMQGLFGYPVIDTGLLLAARGIGVLITTGIAARLAEKLDPRMLLFTGFATVAYSLWQMTDWSLAMDWRPIVLSGFVQGLGVGLVFVPLNVITFATLPPHFRTDAASLVNLTRNIGASVGISIVAALLARNIQVSHADLAAHVTEFSLPVDPNIALRIGSAGDAVMAMLDGEINRQAAMIAYIDDFYFLMWLTIAALPLVLLLRKPEGREAGDEAHLIFE
jgi:DHA2 family multidrug resistance protein